MITAIPLARVVLSTSLALGKDGQRLDFSSDTHTISFLPEWGAVRIAKDGANVIIPREHILRIYERPA